jgi:hypothetical protein
MRMSVSLLCLAAASCGSVPEQERDLSEIPDITLAAGQRIVATCGSSQGHSYYLPIGIVQAKDAGWHEDGIAEGYFYVIEGPEGYDVVSRDGTGERTSAAADGARIEKVRQGPSDVAFSLIYESGGQPAEIYTLYRADDGSEHFTYLVSRGGTDGVHKSAIMAGRCQGLVVD